MTEPRARLLCRTGELTGATYELGASGTIGRDSTNDVVLLAETVSGRHARVYSQDGVYFLEDVGSSNGTEVDGILVTSPVQLGRLNIITFSEVFDVIFQTLEGGMSTTAPTRTSSPATPQASAPASAPEPSDIDPSGSFAGPPEPHTGDHTRVDLEAFAPMPVLREATPQVPSASETTEAEPPGPTYYLIVEVGDGPPREFLLSPGENTVGRSDDCSVTINHQSLSRTHASVAVTADGLVLKDLGSTNGTYVEGTEITEAGLPDVGHFKLGSDVSVRIEKR